MGFILTLQYLAPAHLIFGSCQLDCLHRTLARSDQGRVIRLPCAEMLLLAFLLEHAGALHDKERLLLIGWEGRPISPNSLTVAIANIRRHLLGLDGELEIRSIPKKGYILNLLVPLERPSQAEKSETVTTKLMPAQPTKKIASSPRWFKPLLVSVNLLSLILLALLGLITASEWLPVNCHDENGNIVCALDAEKTQAREQLTQHEDGDTLLLISGPVQRQLSQRSLLNIREDKHNENP